MVNKTLDKEERKRNLIQFSRWQLLESPFAHHVPQIILTKEGKESQLVWDGTSKTWAYDITMNGMTSIEGETDITFGYIYMAFIIWLWNMKKSYPHEDILLAFINILSCF